MKKIEKEIKELYGKIGWKYVTETIAEYTTDYYKDDLPPCRCCANTRFVIKEYDKLKKKFDKLKGKG